MGKRVRKKWDLPSAQLVPLAVLFGSFLLGGLLGTLLAALADNQGGEDLCFYLTDYLRLVADGVVFQNFWSGIWSEFRYLLVVFFLGLTEIGVLGLPVLFSVRGFFLSFSVACFFRVFGSAGILPALFLFGLPAVFWGPALFLSGIQGMFRSRDLLRGSSDSHSIRARCWGKAIVSVILIVLCGLVEYHVVPVLLRAAARVVLK